MNTIARRNDLSVRRPAIAPLIRDENALDLRFTGTLNCCQGRTSGPLDDACQRQRQLNWTNCCIQYRYQGSASPA